MKAKTAKDDEPVFYSWDHYFLQICKFGQVITKTVDKIDNPINVDIPRAFARSSQHVNLSTHIG